MATLQETKKRRSSIQKTRKITKAMQLVAIAKIRRSQENLSNVQEYFNAIYDTVQKMMYDVKDLSKLFPKPKTKKKAFIVITSDLGLCGAYNINALRILKKAISPDDKVYMLGNRGISFATANQIEVTRAYPNIGDKIDYLIANEIAREIISLYKAQKIGAVKLIYTKFVNSMTFDATQRTLLPIDPPPLNLDTAEIKLRSDIYFEPSPDEIIKNLLPLYISSVIFGTAIESKLSEMSSRRTAMENATDNADDLIEQLNVVYNRVRQAKITQEISEIVAGANAMS